MSETMQAKTHNKGAKGLGRGLGSLLGPGGEGAFSKTVASPLEDQTIEKLTANMPSQSEPAFRAPMVDLPAVSIATPMSVPMITPVTTESVNPPIESPVPVQPTQPAPQIPNHLRVWNLAIEKVNPNPYQPRQVFDKEPLQELAESIKEKGIIQPILVRKKEDSTFEIIAGERRWRAAQLAGLKEIPALIKDSDTKEVLELALIENIQRENLNPMEEAEAYEFLLKKYNMTQVDLAQKVGKDRATVANVLRLLQLQPAVRQMVSNKEISLGQAKVLLSLPDAKLQESLAVKARDESLSVRILEKLVAKAKLPPQKEEKQDPRNLAAKTVEEELQKLLGSKVVLDYNQGQGRIVISFYSDQELNQIVDTLRDSWRN